MITTRSRWRTAVRGVRTKQAAVLALAALTVMGSSSCGADPHLQRQEARAFALTCHSLKERDRVTPVPSIPAAPFREVIEDPPTPTGGKTNRDLLVKVVCPAQDTHQGLLPRTFRFPFGSQATTTTTTTTTTAPAPTPAAGPDTTTAPTPGVPPPGPGRRESGTR